MKFSSPDFSRFKGGERNCYTRKKRARINTKFGRIVNHCLEKDISKIEGKRPNQMKITDKMVKKLQIAAVRPFRPYLLRYIKENSEIFRGG